MIQRVKLGEAETWAFVCQKSNKLLAKEMHFWRIQQGNKERIILGAQKNNNKNNV